MTRKNDYQKEAKNKMEIVIELEWNYKEEDEWGWWSIDYYSFIFIDLMLKDNPCNGGLF